MNLLAHAGLSDPSTTSEKAVLALSLLWLPITLLLMGGAVLLISSATGDDEPAGAEAGVGEEST